MVDILDAAVVGAGWAGLGISNGLAAAGFSHRVLERSRIAETWRTQRWDSFHMNTTKVMTVMPGDRYTGSDPEGFYTCDEFIALLEDFAARKQLPVETQTAVTELSATGDDGVYRLATSRGELRARNVVIASGNLNRPRRPGFAGALPSDVHQLDTPDYRSPAALPVGAVLVVGSAQSGGQVAEDLALAGRTVFLSTGHVGRNARRYRGRDISFWQVQTGMFDVPRKDFVDSTGRAASRPLLGAVHTLSLQSLSAQGVVLLGRLTGIEDGRLRFADDVAENVRYGDEISARTKRQIDDYIARHGLDAEAPVDDPAEVVPLRLTEPPILSLDLKTSGITTIIWCVGFEGDFSWVRLPAVLDARGQPVQEQGATALPGIYFAGLDFSFTRKSGTILGVAEESQHLLEQITARVRAR